MTREPSGPYPDQKRGEFMEEEGEFIKQAGEDPGEPAAAKSKLGEAAVREAEVRGGIEELTPCRKETPAVTAFQGQSKRQFCRSLGNYRHPQGTMESG